MTEKENFKYGVKKRNYSRNWKFIGNVKKDYNFIEIDEIEKKFELVDKEGITREGTYLTI